MADLGTRNSPDPIQRSIIAQGDVKRVMAGRLLEREEYIEQAYAFRTFREMLDDNVPSQEILTHLSQELLATADLPKAIDFLRGEVLHCGRISNGMARLG